MKVHLKDFQEDTVTELVVKIRQAAYESRTGKQAITLSSPTGSGKTIMATVAIERLIEGDGSFGPDPEATFVWLSDQPELNEQTRRKILDTSSLFDPSKLIVIDSSFDSELFSPNRVYFLNIQKLGKEKQLVTYGDRRTFTIWDTINNTTRLRPHHFFLIIDEAHRGMRSARETQDAETIVQKFIKGAAGEVNAVPIVVGVSATPERFENLIRGTGRTRRQVDVDVEAVRASGLLKDSVRVFNPTKKEPADMSMMRTAAEGLKQYTKEWSKYCTEQDERTVEPILVVQVEDGTENQISKTDIDQCIKVIEDVIGIQPASAFAHAFQEQKPINTGTRDLRYVAPPDIHLDPQVRVVFFKSSLNTGWDCPRAEVMMSFRKANDATLIAQLVGRMVRNPLARRIESNDFLNSVALFLPHYDAAGLRAVIERLTSPDAGGAPVDVRLASEIVQLQRRKGMEKIFQAAETVPSYTVPRLRKSPGVRRLKKLARLLAHDEIKSDAIEEADKILIGILDRQHKRLKVTDEFRNIVEAKGKVTLRATNWQITGQLAGDETIEISLGRENLEDLFDAAGRKLGEGLHKLWWRHRLDEDEEAKSTAKLEAVALASTVEVLDELEARAQEKTREWLTTYRTKINDLGDARKTEYAEVRQLASNPEASNLDLPASIPGGVGEPVVAEHLFVDEKENYHPSPPLNNWELPVVQQALRENGVVGWLRNEPRKPWSFTVPYSEGGEVKPFYPDFLFFRKSGSSIEVDILDPHRVDLADAPLKAAGLADYADKHHHLFGRIQLIIVDGERIKRIDLIDEKIRSDVRRLTTTAQLRALYDAA